MRTRSVSEVRVHSATQAFVFVPRHFLLNSLRVVHDTSGRCMCGKFDSSAQVISYVLRWKVLISFATAVL